MISKKLGLKIAQLYNTRDSARIMMKSALDKNDMFSHNSWAIEFATATVELRKLGIPCIGGDAYMSYLKEQA